jgi:hypothetical protein
LELVDLQAVTLQLRMRDLWLLTKRKRQ